MVVQRSKAHRLRWVLDAEVDPRVGARSLPPAFAGGVGRMTATWSLCSQWRYWTQLLLQLSVCMCGDVCPDGHPQCRQKKLLPWAAVFFLWQNSCGLVPPLPVPRGGWGLQLWAGVSWCLSPSPFITLWWESSEPSLQGCPPVSICGPLLPASHGRHNQAPAPQPQGVK